MFRQYSKRGIRAPSEECRCGCALWRCERRWKVAGELAAHGSEPLYYNHNLTHEPEDRPNFKSRYWDISSKPLYPFGYGLSYTTFKFSNLHLSKSSMSVSDTNEISVDVTNTGSVPGDAVAQIYIHQRYGSASRPVRELKGFERIALQQARRRLSSFL